jgi:aspartyl-tRNA(Asn)/glutamyl-tRNA(Gln) amidotransferase subunit A
MSEIIACTVAELSRKLAAKSLSAVELASTYLDRIDALNASYNAFVTVDREQTLAGARAADALRASGDAGPLTGVPIAHKDLFCAEGWKTSCGSKMLDNFVSPYDSTVIARFKTAGAVNLGKCNMDEFAMGSSNENSYYGPVKNPWDVSRVPGGSSGGSAAAVAARLAPAATGTDTGGSIRQPASFCGLHAAAQRHGRLRREGFDQRRPAGRGLRPRPEPAAGRLADRPAQGILRTRHGRRGTRRN